MKNVSLKYIALDQPIGTLYLTKMNANILNEITESDVRKAYNDTFGYNETKGLQRKLSDQRVKSIRDYCLSGNAIFPTPIIISAPRDYFNINEKDEEIIIDYYKLLKDEEYCSTVDGQHRLKGIEEAKMLEKFELPVLIGIGLNKGQEIELFATINGNQKPVNKSLLIDLYGELDKPSLEKIGNKVAKVMNSNENSSLYGRIKMLGVKDSDNVQYVSQSTFVDGLLSLITNNVKKDNNDLLNGRPLEYMNEDKFIFRKYIREDDIVEISYICLKYFNEISEILYKFELSLTKRFYRSIGFFSLFYLLRDVYPYFLENANFSILKKCFEQYFNEFKNKEYSSSLSGAKKLYEDLKTSLPKYNSERY
ncbi:DGQHR domain-containing protein [Staphylococcus epidermidis]|uniref:DGQHR domain-containing protein n=1 Tax=Staphylococcus epidermidis TaxID=1282 RepID=UPI002553F7BF|nr:DGQHR domain-containing protein [Staphylococcus epidermidis]MDK7969463.1 DGQHR domain-containing protein [Staphylococcus epidermidis]